MEKPIKSNKLISTAVLGIYRVASVQIINCTPVNLTTCPPDLQLTV